MFISKYAGNGVNVVPCQAMKNTSLQSEVLARLRFSFYLFMSGTCFQELEGTFLFHYLHRTLRTNNYK